MNADKLKGCLAAFWGALATIVFIAIVAALAICSAGCVEGKGSHQHGIVAYVDTRGRFGLGYGETEDVPPGTFYYRRVVQCGPAAFWQGFGTNYTDTVTIWLTSPDGQAAPDEPTAPTLPSNSNSPSNPLPSQTLPTDRTDGDPQPPAEN